MLSKRWTPKGLRKVRKSIMGQRGRTPESTTEDLKRNNNKEPRFDRNWLGLHNRNSDDFDANSSHRKSTSSNMDESSIGPSSDTTEEGSSRTTSPTTCLASEHERNEISTNSKLSNEHDKDAVTSAEFPGLREVRWIDVRSNGKVDSLPKLPIADSIAEDRQEDESGTNQPRSETAIVVEEDASSVTRPQSPINVPTTPFSGSDSPPTQWPTPERRGLVSELSVAVEHLEGENKRLRKEVKRLANALGEEHTKVIRPLEQSLAQVTAERDEVTQELDMLTSEHYELTQELDLVTAEHDGLKQELDLAADEIEELRQELDLVIAEKDELKQELGPVTAEKDELKQELDLVTTERDELAQELGLVTAAKDELKQELDLVTSEHDELAQEFGLVTAEKDELKHELDLVTSEHDELAQELSLVTAEKDELKQELDLVTTEHDELAEEFDRVIVERNELKQELVLVTAELESSLLDEESDEELAEVQSDVDSTETHEEDTPESESNEMSLYYEVEAMMAQADDLIYSILQDDHPTTEATDRPANVKPKPEATDHPAGEVRDVCINGDVTNCKDMGNRGGIFDPGNSDAMGGDVAGDTPTELVKKLSGLLDSDKTDEEQQKAVLCHLDALAVFLNDEDTARDSQQMFDDDDSLDGYLSSHSEFDDEADSGCLHELRAELEQIGHDRGQQEQRHLYDPSQQHGDDLLNDSSWSLFHEEDFSLGLQSDPEVDRRRSTQRDDACYRHPLQVDDDSSNLHAGDDYSQEWPLEIVISSEEDFGSLDVGCKPWQVEVVSQQQPSRVENLNEASLRNPAEEPKEDELLNQVVLTPPTFEGERSHLCERTNEPKRISEETTPMDQSAVPAYTPNWRRHLDLSFLEPDAEGAGLPDDKVTDPSQSSGLSSREVSELHFWLLHYQRKCAMYEQERNQVVDAALELFDISQRAKDAEMATLKNQVALLQMDLNDMAGEKADSSTDDCSTTTEDSTERGGMFPGTSGADERQPEKGPLGMGYMRLIAV